MGEDSRPGGCMWDKCVPNQLEEQGSTLQAFQQSNLPTRQRQKPQQSASYLQPSLGMNPSALSQRSTAPPAQQRCPTQTVGVSGQSVWERSVAPFSQSGRP